MSKQKVHPGGILDILSPEEFLAAHKDGTNAILRALGRNERFNRIIETTTVNSDGTWSLKVGPPDGFLWSVMWVQFSAAAGTMNMYMGEATQLNLLGVDFGLNQGVQTYGSEQMIVPSGNVLTFTQGTTNSTAGTNVAVQLMVKEVPFGHEAQMI